MYNQNNILELVVWPTSAPGQLATEQAGIRLILISLSNPQKHSKYPFLQRYNTISLMKTAKSCFSPLTEQTLKNSNHLGYPHARSLSSSLLHLSLCIFAPPSPSSPYAPMSSSVPPVLPNLSGPLSSPSSSHFLIDLFTPRDP